jgi:DNA primase large subunit
LYRIDSPDDVRTYLENLPGYQKDLYGQNRSRIEEYEKKAAIGVNKYRMVRSLLEQGKADLARLVSHNEQGRMNPNFRYAYASYYARAGKTEELQRIFDTAANAEEKYALYFAAATAAIIRSEELRAELEAAEAAEAQ